MKTKSILLTVLCGLLTMSSVHAEEGGTGHYLPGSMSSFVDAVPPTPTFIARFNFLYYGGSYGGTPLPFARLVAADIRACSALS